MNIYALCNQSLYVLAITWLVVLVVLVVAMVREAWREK